MKKAFTVLILISILPVIQVYAQEKDTNLSRPSVRLELIHYYDQNQLSDGGAFLSEIITALGKKEKGIPQEDIDWLLNKIRLDIVRQTKKLYTDKGEEIEIPYFGVGFPHSSDFKYFIFNTCDYSKRIAENPRTELVRTSDGAVIWEIKTMMMDAFVSNDGATVVDITTALPPVFRELRNIRFHDANGSVTRTIDNLSSLPEWITMTNDGSLCVVFDRVNGGTFIAYDSFGNEIWRKPVFCGNLTAMDFFNNTEFFLCTYVSDAIHTLLIDRKGEIIGDYNFAIRKGNFSDDGKYLIFNVTRDSVNYLNIQNAEVLHERIVDGLTANTDHYFVNMFDKLDVEGTIMLSKSGIVQGIYLKQGEVSPNKHIIITPTDILLLEVKNAK